MTEQEYKDLVEEHKQWVASFIKFVLEDEPTKKTKRK